MVTEYQQGSSFPGVVGRTVEQSSPAWPAPIRAKDRAPNVLFFVLDDVGYGQLSCFGGLVNTPNIDRCTTSTTISGCRSSACHRPVRCRAAPGRGQLYVDGTLVGSAGGGGGRRDGRPGEAAALTGGQAGRSAAAGAGAA